jgi:hypothetical protein
MKGATLHSLVQRLWEIGLDEPFTPGALLSALSDSWVECRDLTESALSDVLDGRSPATWGDFTGVLFEIAGSLDSAPDKMSNRQVIAAAFSACALADAARAGLWDWRLFHPDVMNLCAILAGRIQLEEFLLIMAYIFGKDGEPLRPF